MDTTGRVRRPGIVGLACGMLAAGGVLFAAEVKLSGDKYFTDMRTYEQAAHDGVIENDTAWAAAGVTIHWTMTVVGVFVGLALAVLAVLAFFGLSWARVVSWVFGLPILLWYGVLALLNFPVVSVVGDVAEPDPARAELARRLEEAWPSWLGTLDVVLMVSVSVLLIAALVCQTVPAADAYFRRNARGSGQGDDLSGVRETGAEADEQGGAGRVG
ncbi:hypothetical protein [Actinoplanes sp. NPDC048796]|uniref:hypothetical protein n=1 Tax=Actinoplanes sp. NPDC048796 TaxID=3155640 RepID=UPI0033F57FA3